jgi:hypothetical protein
MFDPVKLEHRGKVIKDLSSSTRWNSFITNMDNLEFDYAYIPAGLENRPDLLSHAAYGTAGYWWLILLANNVEDAYSGLPQDALIRIPRL